VSTCTFRRRWPAPGWFSTTATARTATDDSIVTLTGHVRTWAEHDAVVHVVLPRADAILRRRLARADEMTRHFLRAASVVLDTSDELAPITYVMESDTKDAIAALSKACEIRLMREGSHGEVSFVHALMQREVYADMGRQPAAVPARAGGRMVRAPRRHGVGRLPLRASRPVRSDGQGGLPGSIPG
jgi:hypothetical protein